MSSISKLLRRALLANGAFSALCGVLFFFNEKMLGLLLGVNLPTVIYILSSGLVLYALWLFWNARRDEVGMREAWLAVGMDLAWVVGSFVLIQFEVLNPIGNWLVAVLATIVLMFAVLQFLGITRRARPQSFWARPWLPLIAVLLLLGEIGFAFTHVPLADVRTSQLKREGYTASAAQKGKELLQRVAARHGLAAWQNYRVAEMVGVDEWAEGTTSWWPQQQQRLKMQTLLRTFTSRVELLDRGAQNEVLGIHAWRGYKKSSEESAPRFVEEDVLTFYLPALHYFAELPLRLLHAEFVAYGGEKTLRGKKYHLLYATWGSFAPNAEHDQYLLWIDPETLLVEICWYTVRDRITWATGTIYFEDYREVQGVTFSFRHTIVLPRPEATLFPLEQNFFHRLLFERVQFDGFDEQTLLLDPAEKVGDFKPRRNTGAR